MITLVIHKELVSAHHQIRLSRSCIGLALFQPIRVEHGGLVVLVSVLKMRVCFKIGITSRLSRDTFTILYMKPIAHCPCKWPEW